MLDHPAEPRLPKQCPKCHYDLAGTSYERGFARCPECGLNFQQFVPAMNWPMRCANCKTELTGEPICAGRVECPKCALVQWSTTLKPQRPRFPLKIFVGLLAVIVVVPILIYLWLFAMFPTV